ncbi:hypothetical protein OY671_008254, partial [Metschnikowia pulcherrima]
TRASHAVAQAVSRETCRQIRSALCPVPGWHIGR